MARWIKKATGGDLVVFGCLIFAVDPLFREKELLGHVLPGQVFCQPKEQYRKLPPSKTVEKTFFARFILNTSSIFVFLFETAPSALC